MRSSAAFAALLTLFAVSGVHADAIQKWRTADGALYFGDRPPPGSTLLETVPDTPASGSAPAGPSELERAAADGRDIIRRREAARAEELRQQAERDLQQAEIEASVAADDYDSPLWFIETRPPCAPGERCFAGERHHHHHHDDRSDRSGSGWRSPPRSRIEEQWSRWSRPSAPLRPRQRDGGGALTPYRR